MGRFRSETFEWEDSSDNFQTAEIATLVNTYNRTIYSDVRDELNRIGSRMAERSCESAKLHESVLDDLDRTSADSVGQLTNSSRGADFCDVDGYDRFSQMFLFQAERHVRPGIIAHLLNVFDVDYEILDIN